MNALVVINISYYKISLLLKINKLAKMIILKIKKMIRTCFKI